MDRPRRIQYEPLQAKTILNSVKAPSMPFDWSINPYRGCQHGCSFCYARSTHSFLGVEADDTFQRHIFIKEGAADILREQLRKRLRGKHPSELGQVAIGTATDPYQQIEAKSKVTRGCLEVLAEYQVPVTITTRSPLILRDMDLLLQLPLASVNISLSTLDPLVWRQFEPSTPAPAQRLRTVRKLAEAGIPVGIFAAPILPYLTDSETDLRSLLAASAEAGAGFVMPSYLRLSTPEVKVWFFQTLRQHYPQLAAPYARLYQASSSLPPEYKTPKMQMINRLLELYPQLRHTVRSPYNPQAVPVHERTAAKDDGREQEPVQLTLF
ncbi:radical SAM protein [Paenibacillus doosanensis]|uniref:SPL family radical SAM protein n=1 Tax=Paenibacillus doosanensis TaxID=1229154 RepID=UPI00217F41CC|nr:radical SAM protein [Paenibacillus doosanensis]MCS7459087.1 radical SAM protein [Paenibacillus doosanensis]